MTAPMTLRALPNLLTALRIMIALAVFAGLARAAEFEEQGGGPAWLIPACTAAFVVCALTDWFDGWLARRWRAESAWGAILDPIADKIAVMAAVLGLLLIEPRASLAAAGLLILGRELFVSGLREVGAARGVRFPVTRLAKWKTAVQLAALTLEIAGALRPGLVRLAADALLWLAVAMTLWTGWGYARAARRQLAGFFPSTAGEEADVRTAPAP